MLIAGIAGASLGTEIAKALNHAGGYDVLGCDISPLAFGHYDSHFNSTFLVDRETYAQSLLDLCVREEVECLIPGGDEPAVLIGRAHELFARAGIKLGQNNPQLTERLAHKGQCFEILKRAGVRTPRTLTVEPGTDISDFPMPCIVKPAVASGGSVFVFFAKSREEARLYCTYLHNNGRAPVIQEYLSEDGGEFTVGVLSLPDGTCAGAIALKRAFNSKLSVSMRGTDFLISSGYSQGLIEAYPAVCEIAELIAHRLGSTGPLNIQGRMTADGTFVPFEINARFSASTYLRTLAGFNEVDFYVQRLLGRSPRSALDITPGWYLRTLSEVAVPLDKVVK
ncbi:ATP-grasp domain-containing protein [Mycobacterium sp. Marseille-P9652]|uniref:ATP-grasp domain-containing protein n=1 Tax=Mycobacterium sp. Marseille-P9652 TaxID=2654950 RepID=UPI0018D0C5E7|nr:ATP-grasp domain-containing protein [Mycobacterium sp. Marseille-P9652]